MLRQHNNKESRNVQKKKFFFKLLDRLVHTNEHPRLAF
jgi:hypothetical protein